MKNYERILITKFMSSLEVEKPHIIALKLQKYLNKKVILSIFDEGWDLVENGFEKILLEICNEIKFNIDDIIIESANPDQSLNYFKHQYLGFNGDAALLDPVTTSISLPDKFNYGQFYARPLDERLYSFYKHVSWNHNSRGIASMHLDIQSINECGVEYRNFIVHENKKWQVIKPLLPYSDVGKYIRSPIGLEYHNNQDFWYSTYKKIAIEVVGETNQSGTGFFMTEKTLRPMLYGRLFLIISNPKFELKLKKLGFDIFDDIIDKTYDDKISYSRIEHLYGVLDGILTNYNLKWFETLIPRLEKNKKIANNFLLENKEKLCKWKRKNLVK